MKRFLALLVALSILTLSGTVLAASSDMPASSAYYDAVSRVTSLGLMDNAANNAFKPNDATTREQFARLIVMAAGLGDSADSMQGPTIFPDVPANGEDNGCINLSISKGYMAGLADGKFHPSEAVTYAQAVTAMIRVLGYTDADIPGTWPQNYIAKAKALGLAVNSSLTAASKVSRGIMAQMLDVLLDTKIKAANTQEASKTLAEASGLTTAGMYTVYSKPVVYHKAGVANSSLGGIDLSGKLSIVKNSVDNSTDPATTKYGESIKPGDLQEYNILYQVSDKSGKNKYVLVIDNRVTGTLTGILPDKKTPQKVEIDGRQYEIDNTFAVSKLTGSDSFNLGDNVTLLLGYDGKAVDIRDALYSDNSNFAFVINYGVYKTTDKYDYGSARYTVKLLLSNGSTDDFECNTTPSALKGKLVQYAKESNNSVDLTSLDYSSAGQAIIDKDNRKLFWNGSYYGNDITGNVKVFNFISNNSGMDAQAEVLSWSDVPSVLQSGQIIYMNKTGEFDDVNLMLLDNVSSSSYQMGFVKSIKKNTAPGKSSYALAIIVNGKDYNYEIPANDYGIVNGSVVRVTLLNNSIDNIVEVRYPDTQSTTIRAVDKDRIRISNRTYTFADNKYIYMIDSTGGLKSIDTTQLRTDALYDQVSVYTDVSYSVGGKAQIVVVRSN